MPEDRSPEIDSLTDFMLIERLMSSGANAGVPLRAAIKRIKLVFTDVDGVLTDGGMFYTRAGDTGKMFNTRDGMGFELLRKKGYVAGIITKENSEVVLKRAAKLKLEEVYVGVDDKLALVKDLCRKYSVSIEDVAYIGDDVNDVPVLKAVGLPVSVADAQPEAKSCARYITAARGGQGAFRELARLLLDEK